MTRLLIPFLLLLALPSWAQEKKKTETLVVRSSTVCDMCVTTIEGNVIYEKGVKKVKVDLASSTIVVDYDPRRTDPDAIRRSIVALGYSADGTPGDARAFSKLPDCCQKEGCGKLPEQQ